jgi:hypothetical protein
MDPATDNVLGSAIIRISLQSNHALSQLWMMMGSSLFQFESKYYFSLM